MNKEVFERSDMQKSIQRHRIYFPRLDKFLLIQHFIWFVVRSNLCFCKLRHNYDNLSRFLCRNHDNFSRFGDYESVSANQCHHECRIWSTSPKSWNTNPYATSFRRWMSMFLIQLHNVLDENAQFKWTWNVTLLSHIVLIWCKSARQLKTSENAQFCLMKMNVGLIRTRFLQKTAIQAAFF